MLPNQLLATYPFVGRLSPESRRQLEAGGRVQVAAKGDCLLRKGDRIRGLYLVLAGRLRVYALAPNGDEVTLYSVEPGESCPLAMNALLAESRHQAWVEAESRAVKLYFLPAPDFRELYEKERGVREFTLAVLSGRISTLMTVLENLSLQTVAERLKGHLLRSADDRGDVVGTHEEIALALGTAREVVTRQLRQLARAGLIRTQRGRIRILQPGLLR